MSTPTVPQMVARSLSGHHNALRAFAEHRSLDPTGTMTLGGLRGYRTVLATLRRWGALDAEGELTETGRALLAALDAKRR